MDTVSINGMIITPRMYTSTYSLDSDCTGTETITTITPTPHPPPAHLHIVVVDDGRTVELVVTDPGTVVAGESVTQKSRTIDASAPGAGSGARPFARPT